MLGSDSLSNERFPLLTHHNAKITGVGSHKSDTRYLIPVYPSQRLAIYRYRLLSLSQSGFDPFSQYRLERVGIHTRKYLVQRGYRGDSVSCEPQFLRYGGFLHPSPLGYGV